MSRLLRIAVVRGIALLPCIGIAQSRRTSPPAAARERAIDVPDPDEGAASPASRAAAQANTVGEFEVFYRFHFTDRLRESGITFRHHAVSDALQTYKAIHHDHGGALAVADVDGDGLYETFSSPTRSAATNCGRILAAGSSRTSPPRRASRCRVP